MKNEKLYCPVCGKGPLRFSFRCTNRCCSSCHNKYCTPGGSTYPGHNLNLEAARADFYAKEQTK